MLRITIYRDESTVTITLQGKFAANWVGEVLDTWTKVSSTGQTVSVDLSEVSYVDRAGRRLLAKMHAAGALLAGSGLMIRGLIEEITSQGA